MKQSKKIFTRMVLNNWGGMNHEVIYFHEFVNLFSGKSGSGKSTAMDAMQVVLYGSVASDFLNIRQLCCTLKKQIYVACRQLTFDPNSEMLWINFKNKIRPILEKMKADQGIQDYEFVKIANAPKATLKAQIRIVPIEAVEDFEIDVTLEDSLDGVVIGESEAE